MRKLYLIMIVFLTTFLLESCFTKPPVIEENMYTVTFYDEEGNVIHQEEVKEGSSATAPIPPIKEGYVFDRWNKDYTNVTKDLDVYPIYIKEQIKEYVVRFYANGILLDEQKIKENESAIAPVAPNLSSHSFKGWDQNFTKITSNLNVNAIYERWRFVSYMNDFTVGEIGSVTHLIDHISKATPVVTFINVIAGKFRNTNELHYYDHSHYVTRNVYGFEVAVNQEGIVIDVNTLVDIPTNGFILSGHGTSATELKNKVKIGDLIIYDFNTETAKVFRDSTNSPVIYLGIKIEHAKQKIINAMNNFKAVDYELLNEKINQLVTLYNELLVEYEYDKYRYCDKLLLDIDFILVETRPVQTNAIWHYPTRSGSYSESSRKEVERLLDQYQQMGINRVYLNTNFNGKAIYKSEYLDQALTNFYTYEGYKDYLECFIEEAHKRNILVYAWTNTLIAGDGMNNRFYSDRGWILTGYNGEDNFGGMYFVDISNDDVQNFLKNVFYELSSEYNLDGIEFDFIRYPNGNLHSFSQTISEDEYINDSGYTESFINRFKELFPFEGDFKTLIRTNPTLRVEWLEFKTTLLTNFVRDLTTTIRSAHSNLEITAAVMPSISGARSTYRQDWLTWIQNGYIDVLEPMIYTGDTSYLLSQLANMYNVVNGDAEIIVGVFPEGSGAQPGVNAEQLDAILELYPVGWSKFSSKTILGHTFYKDSFKHIYRPYTAQSTSSKEDIYRAYITDLTEKVLNYYQYVVDCQNLTIILEDDQLIKQTTYQEVLTNIQNTISEIDNIIIRNRLTKTNQHIMALLNN